MSPASHSKPDLADGYDAPEYWDLAFSDETLPEADFIQAVHEKSGRGSASAKSSTHQETHDPEPRFLEVACGGGRQVLELARRGFRVSAFDLNTRCVDFVRERLRKEKLRADVFAGDMVRFQTEHQFDLIHCLMNSFRHLTTEADAHSHLQSVSDALKPSGIYLCGLHLLPPDASEDDCERWTVQSGTTRVTTTIRVLNFSRRTRIETVRFSLKVTTPNGIQRFRADHQLRIYRADQMRNLLRKVPSLKLIGVYDFNYDLTTPLRLNDELGDTVLVLQRQP